MQRRNVTGSVGVSRVQLSALVVICFFFFQAEDGIRDIGVTGVQTCALPISAEINLRESDLTNMGLARAANLPVILVGDIDRGGLFASLYGTLALLSPEDQALVAGFLVNKFRGDPAVLAPGLEGLGRLTGRPFIGTLPYVSGLGIDGEDSLALDAPRAMKPPLGRAVLRVAVARLGRSEEHTSELQSRQYLVCRLLLEKK